MPFNSATINHVALTTNVVTITTGTHGYTGTPWVTVSSTAHPTINGYFQIATIPTTTTFTYSLTLANIVSVADTGVVIPDTYETIARKDIATILAKTITQAGQIATGTDSIASGSNLLSSILPTGFGLILESNWGKWDGQIRQNDREVTTLLYFSALPNISQPLYSFENIVSKIRDDIATESFWTAQVSNEISMRLKGKRTDSPAGLNIYEYEMIVTFRDAAKTS